MGISDKDVPCNVALNPTPSTSILNPKLDLGLLNAKKQVLLTLDLLVFAAAA